MAETSTLNVRMDAETKRDFTAFCDEIGISASSLMNVFARTVVRNQEVPFPMTTRSIAEVPSRYRAVFPALESEVTDAIDASVSVSPSECLDAKTGAATVRKRMGW
ncbi:MAG: type II toxin-antitoxin system RelB/DinJ family antitoxin [Atopobiaceae bacterium]